jgi:hypothetical protein
MGETKATDSAKDRWDRSHYTQVKVSVSPDVAEAFKLACARSGVSMASEIGSFMAKRAGRSRTESKLPPVSTRRRRRKEVSDLLNRLTRVLEAEENYRDYIPENLRGSTVYDSANSVVDALYDVTRTLEELYE